MTRPLVPITTVRSGSRTLLDMPGASFSSLSSFGEFFIEKTIGLRQGIGRWREIFVHSGNTNKQTLKIQLLQSTIWTIPTVLLWSARAFLLFFLWSVFYKFFLLGYLIGPRFWIR